MKKLRFFIICTIALLLASNTLYAAEYVAFSLKVAQEWITSISKDKDYRKLHPEIFTLGGITTIRGLVYDRKVGDIILIGERNLDRTILTLDDFVVALKARFIHGKWPLASIDPMPEMENMQIVRFEGGIEDTQFGQDLFEADYKLKKIYIGLIPSGIQGIKTGWDLMWEKAKNITIGNHKINSRLWFYPILPSVSIRENVAAIKGLKVGVFTEVLSAEIDGKKIEDLSTFRDPGSDEFSMAISDNFRSLAKLYHAFSRLQGLNELVALTLAIQEMDEKLSFEWWLKNYKVKEVKTKRDVKVLKKSNEIIIKGGIQKKYYELSGGVELSAIALRLKAGDVIGLKDAILKTRPKSNSLSWRFVISEWLIPTTPGMLKLEDIADLVAQAEFLQNNKHYRDVTTILDNIILLNPELDWAYNNRGVAYQDLGQTKRAISDYTKALTINPKYVDALGNLGNIYINEQNYTLGFEYLEKAIKITPTRAELYNNRGVAYLINNEFIKAIEDFNKSIFLNRDQPTTYVNRGIAYREMEEYSKAFQNFKYALSLKPLPDIVCRIYSAKALTYCSLGHFDKAFEYWDKAIDLDPEGEVGKIAKFCKKLAKETKQKFESPFNALVIMAGIIKTAWDIGKLKVLKRRLSKTFKDFYDDTYFIKFYIAFDESNHSIVIADLITTMYIIDFGNFPSSFKRPKQKMAFIGGQNDKIQVLVTSLSKDIIKYYKNLWVKVNDRKIKLCPENLDTFIKEITTL